MFAIIYKKLYRRHSFRESRCVDEFEKSSFIHQFTKNYGMTPYRYLLSIRIDEAKKLLAKQQSLSEVALMTNFSDQSHFSNVFKSFIGLTPKQYQKMYLRSTE